MTTIAWIRILKSHPNRRVSRKSKNELSNSARGYYTVSLGVCQAMQVFSFLILSYYPATSCFIHQPPL